MKPNRITNVAVCKSTRDWIKLLQGIYRGLAMTGSHSDMAIMWKNYNVNYISTVVHTNTCSAEECIANTEEVNVIQILSLHYLVRPVYCVPLAPLNHIIFAE